MSGHSKVDITKAALSFKIIRGRGGQELSVEQLKSELAQASAVCVGEQHTSPHDHWAQLTIVDMLTMDSESDIGVGLEMVQRPFQGVLDDFSAGSIDAATLRERLSWKKRWGYDYALYGPIFALVAARGATLVALNISSELRKKIAKDGLDALPPAERARVPELVTDDPDHRAWWNQVMDEMREAHGRMGGADKNAAKQSESDRRAAEAKDEALMRRMYLSQVLWDETMADSSARWLAAAKPGKTRKLVILAGNGHCHDTAVVGRLRRRGHGPVLSIHPLVDAGDGELAKLLAEPRNDFLFVMSPSKTTQTAN